MATYAIGDIQGCDDALARLLETIAFDPSRDRLWLAGDMVNRGPRSLDVLRSLVALGDRVVAVLGNHDLHLLGRALGVRGRGRRDTLDEILEAPDREALLEWLRTRPLLHREGELVLVHAGVHPAWTVDEAEARAREAEAVIRGPDASALLARGAAAGPPARDPARVTRARGTLDVLTLMRTVRADGHLEIAFTGPPDAAPPGCTPWFEVPGRKSTGVTVVCGHWAALGLHRGDGVLALDSGCVFGRALTACRLDDGAIFQVPGPPRA